ncbi:MAG TPA: DNA-3-methyladenine glycosylase [Chitinophagales bacterium]|nr:DNA-3-methyladenine glycosylase [Chitinophagales bacterium]
MEVIMPLSLHYYLHEDVVFLARDLLGKLLVTEIDGIRTGGIITETEAYSETEKGCHAYGHRKTERTKIMFETGGHSYVYFCYGMHHLFNIVTGQKDTAQAVLIRAIWPTIGITEILRRRNKTKADKQLCNGPGKVCQALGITREHNGILLNEATVWVENPGLIIRSEDIKVTPRIGIDYAGADAHLLWRFVLSLSEIEKYVEKINAHHSG